MLNTDLWLVAVFWELWKSEVDRSRPQGVPLMQMTGPTCLCSVVLHMLPLSDILLKFMDVRRWG